MVKYLGTDDSVNACDCCGKSELKKTVVLDFDGDVRHYGTVCAGRALGRKTKTASDVAAAVEQVNEMDLIKARVDELRAKGSEVVYGRFYINSRSIQTRMQVAAPSDMMVRQVYPGRAA